MGDCLKRQHIDCQKKAEDIFRSLTDEQLKDLSPEEMYHLFRSLPAPGRKVAMAEHTTYMGAMLRPKPSETFGTDEDYLPLSEQRARIDKTNYPSSPEEDIRLVAARVYQERYNRFANMLLYTFEPQLIDLVKRRREIDAVGPLK